MDRLFALVELPGFEPGQTEPKSVVLPLHHSSIPKRKDISNFTFLQILQGSPQNNLLQFIQKRFYRIIFHIKICVYVKISLQIIVIKFNPLSFL